MSAHARMDSRELESDLIDAEMDIEALEEDLASDGLTGDVNDELTELRETRDKIQALKDATENEGWHHGIEFIHEDDFVDYARSYAEDSGNIDNDASWPMMHIDWDAAASDLRSDYSEVEYDGDTYLYRSA